MRKVIIISETKGENMFAFLTIAAKGVIVKGAITKGAITKDTIVKGAIAVVDVSAVAMVTGLAVEEMAKSLKGTKRL